MDVLFKKGPNREAGAGGGDLRRNPFMCNSLAVAAPWSCLLVLPPPPLVPPPQTFFGTIVFKAQLIFKDKKELIIDLTAVFSVFRL